MKFTSIKEVIEKSGANAKAAECLGKSGALNNLGEELNELEAAEYSRNIVSFLRDQEKYLVRAEKYKELVDNKEKKFREKLEERNKKQEEKELKYQEKLKQWEERLAHVKEQNAKRMSQSKKLLKEPQKPSPPRQLKEVAYPKTPVEPEAPLEPIKPRVLLSTRERIRLQREVLNLYISGHPLDEVKPNDQVIEIKNLVESEEDSWCTIQGVLQSIKVTNTRRKQLMGRLRIEDKTGSIEVVAFPHLYESLKGTLVEGELFEVLGKVDITKRQLDNGEESTHVQFIGTKVKPIRIGSDKEWDITYPLLKGNLHVLPSRRQKSKGLATTILLNRVRKYLEEHIE